MSDWVFILPTSVILPRKTKSDAKVSISLNWFRSAHHRSYTEAKKHYKKIVSPQFDGLIKPTGQLHIHYDFYAARNDHPDLDNFVGAAKKFFQDAMVESGFIEEDNVSVIVSASEKYCGIDRDNPRIEAKIQQLGI